MTSPPPPESLLRSEMRLHRRSLLWWSVSIAALVLLVVGVYPSVRDHSSLNSIYGNLDPALQALLGGSDLTSATGYLSTQLFAFFLPAVLLVFALGRGATTLAGEEEEHTLDLLLAQPLARTWAYLHKAAFVVLGISLLTVAAWAPVAAVDSAVRFRLPLVNLAAVCLQLGLFCCLLALAAQGIAAATGRRGVGIAVTTGYTTVSYVLYGLSTTVHPLTYLKPLTPWRWYLANDPLRTGVGWGEVTVLLAACAVAVIIGAARFRARDLHA